MAYGTYILAAGSPGPSNMAIMSIAMRAGRSPALAFALGVMTGSVTWGVLAATGSSALLHAYAGILPALRVAGGAYLLYLAYKAARSAARPFVARETGERAEGPLRAFYLRGLALHLTNPKAILAWVAIIALGLPADAPAFGPAVIVAGCAMLGCLTFGGYALAFSTRPVAAAYARMCRGFDGLLALTFGYAGLRLLLERDA
jgi:threonine/homoserine/homoserine lactone efflux protein